MPNILLNKREELLPLLLLAIQHHPDAQTRDQLLNILFNLMKKPDADQRKVILKGFKKIAKYLGHDKVEAELLPQLWEQIDHKVTRFKTIIKWGFKIKGPWELSKNGSNSFRWSSWISIFGGIGVKKFLERFFLCFVLDSLDLVTLDTFQSCFISRSSRIEVHSMYQ